MGTTSRGALTEDIIMDTLTLAAYILVWPVISLGVLLLIVGATLKEFRQAHENGGDVV